MSSSQVAVASDNDDFLEAKYIYDASEDTSVIDDVFDLLFDHVIQSSV